MLIAERAYNWLKENPGEIANFAWDNRGKVFQGVSNAQRFVSKNILRDKRPIRYLMEGEIHLPSHNFTGPGTAVHQPSVRNHDPYNNIDACSKKHDLEFDEIFKMPLGKEREQRIRDADERAIACYDQFPDDDGYVLARGGINSKMRIEDISPALFDQVMGEAYRGADHGIVLEEDTNTLPRKTRCKKRDKRCIKRQKQQQIGRGNIIDTNRLIMAALPVGLVLYGEYRFGKMIHDFYTARTKPRT
jgi:hypothetical protein